jgi:hypothetical protein
MPLLLLLALVSLAGCGGGGDETSDPTTPADGPLVTYERGGGIAATYVKLTVAGDGSAVIADGLPEAEQKQAVTRFRLSGGDLSELTRAVEAAAPLEKSPSPSGCADCFEYSIETADGKVSFDETAVGDDADGPQVSAEIVRLLAELNAIVEANNAPGE